METFAGCSWEWKLVWPLCKNRTEAAQNVLKKTFYVQQSHSYIQKMGHPEAQTGKDTGKIYQWVATV